MARRALVADASCHARCLPGAPTCCGSIRPAPENTLGLANLVGVAIALGIREEALVSVWCIYAALLSVLIVEHFRRERQLEVRPAYA